MTLEEEVQKLAAEQVDDIYFYAQHAQMYQEDALIRFAREVQRITVEACAQIADKCRDEEKELMKEGGVSAMALGAAEAAGEIAEAIRALPQAAVQFTESQNLPPSKCWK